MLMADTAILSKLTISPFNPLINPQNINKTFNWKGHHYFSFHTSFKGPLKASAMAEVRSAPTICYT